MGSRQRGRSAGQDEAFPVTGTAAAGRGGKGARPQPGEFLSPTSRPPILGRAPRKLLSGGDSQGGYKIERRGCRCDVCV